MRHVDAVPYLAIAHTMSSAKTRAPPALIFAAGAVAGVAAWKALERHLRQRLYAERFAAGPRPPPWLRQLTKVVLGGASNPTTAAGDAAAAAPAAAVAGFDAPPRTTFVSWRSHGAGRGPAAKRSA